MITPLPLRRIAAAVALAGLLAGCGEKTEPGWSGYVEGDYIYVAAPLGGQLATLSVQRGQLVQRGAALFALDATPERAARDEAAARLQGARAQATDATKGRRADELAVSEAQAAQARAQAALAQAELARQQKLFEQGFISRARLDDAHSAAVQANQRVAELMATLRVAKLPARVDERAAAEASAVAAAQALEQSAWREQQMQRAAPADARVADTFFRVGEWVPAGQAVVSLLPPGNVRARFFVPEGVIGSVAPGQVVTLLCDGCGAPIAARIDFVATQAEYTPPVIYSNSQRSRLVFLVEARPDAKDAARLKPGQPIDVRRAQDTHS